MATQRNEEVTIGALDDAGRGARLSSAIESAGIGTYELDLATGRGVWSASAFRLLGAEPPADLTGSFETWARALHPDDAEPTLADHAAAAARGGAWRAQFRILRFDTGELRWLSAAVEFTRGPNGVISAGIVFDVTDQQMASAALAESEARLRTLTNNFPAGAVYQMSAGPGPADRRFLYVSESVERFGGIHAAELLADPTLAYRQLDEASLARVASAEAVSMRDHALFDQEVRFKRRDGVWRWARIVSMPRAQADGSWVWDGIQLDITEQKEAEQQLRELNATLEERVAARAAELAQAQEALRQSQKLESMGQLTGGVAHDFNNLLSPIIGGLDMLQRRQVGDARAQRTIAAALESAERAKLLVQRLLAFARRQPLQPRAVDVIELVRGMASLLESTLGPRIVLTLALPDVLPSAHADANQLEMALLNLVLNARDAMPEGGALTIGARESDGMLTLEVADTGMGMDEETRMRAVEPFFSTKGVGHGTGLGLSMVHGLASQLGGALGIESAPGEGTRITLRLPFAAPDLPAPELSATRRVWRAHGVALLVDDEDLVRASTAEMLADIGFTVVEASSAEAALQRLGAGEAPDLLISDHLMPGMTGAELLAVARRERPDLKVLLVSGYADVDSIASELPRLTKPFRRDELDAAVKLAFGVAD